MASAIRHSQQEDIGKISTNKSRKCGEGWGGGANIKVTKMAIKDTITAVNLGS
jgi:hypothetical protein